MAQQGTADSHRSMVPTASLAMLLWLEECTYITLPPEVQGDHGVAMYKLQKAMYGLKYSGTSGVVQRRAGQHAWVSGSLRWTQRYSSGAACTRSYGDPHNQDRCGCTICESGRRLREPLHAPYILYTANA